MKYIITTLLLTHSIFTFAQLPTVDTLYLNLQQTIGMAQGEAPDVQIAKTSYSNNFWRFRSFQADFKPQILFDATLPNINRSIDQITAPDGLDVFVSRSSMLNSAGVSLSQRIGLTGGEVSLSTGIQRLDIFPSGAIPRQTTYLSSPIFLSIDQPLFQFNSFKWDKKIEPIIFDEAKKGFSEDLEAVAGQSAQLFFSVLIAQLNLEASKRDKLEADSLLTISKGRFEVGKIAETEVLQIELNVMNANANLAQSELNLQRSTEQLRNFLGIKKAIAFKLTPPANIPDLEIDIDKALDFARENRSQILSFRRRILEAERNLAQAIGNTGLNMNLRLDFGLSQTGMDFGDAYRDPLDQERLLLNLRVPIADWGKTQARREIAQSNLELTRLQVTQDEVNFEREIITAVQQFSLVRNQVNLSLRAYEVAQKRLDITRKRYRIGKIGSTDLNLAISEEANARRSYMNALQSFWLAYYELRELTLYDFENNRPLLQQID